MTPEPRTLKLICALALATAFLLFPAGRDTAVAQSIVVMVNDEPVTSYDIAQRQRFLALSQNLGGKMRERLQAPETQQQFQQFMRENQPRSEEEAKALQQKFVERIQQTVIANTSKSMRQQAIDELIDEKLMLQAAREQKIEISDDEVNQMLTRMAQSGSDGRTLEQFLANFKAQGINPSTLKDRIRAQSAWREVIRRVYGSRIRAAAPTNLPTRSNGGAVVDVEIVRLKIGGDGSQKAMAEKLIQAEAIRQGFRSCDQLAGQVRGLDGATVQSVKKADLKDFRGDVQAALQKASAGEITPPVVNGDTIEIHAVCNKQTVASPDESQTADAGDGTQEQFRLYSDRHLKDLKTRALLKYPKSG